MRIARTIFEVDQSVKIENLSAATVLAYSDHMCEAIVIPAQVKRTVIDYLRARGKSKIRATIQLFAMALFLLLKEVAPRCSSIVIDTEYTGYEADIGGILLNYLRRIEPEFGRERLVFRSVGKSSPAHRLAISIHRGKTSPDRILQIEDFLKLLNRK